MNILFIGNSATYVHDLPGMLCRFAKEAGRDIKTASIVKGGYELSRHGDESTDHGKNVLAEIAKGYDVVFLQDNSNCISTEEKRAASVLAYKKLPAAAKKSGARTVIYFRPPAGKAIFGLSPAEQCREFDRHFTAIAKELGAESAYVNRAFAEAIEKTDIDLWGPDNAHVSECGAYLAACVFFATLFGSCSKIKDTNGLPESVAQTLRSIADGAVFLSYDS